MTQAHAEAAQGGGIMRDGKLSYVQIPASDVRASARFYERVFGWRIRDDGNASHLSFEDASGELIGAFVTTIAPGETGVLPYIYVRDIEARVRGIEDAGGAIVRAMYPEGNLRVATFRDPASNIIGIWEANGG